MSRKGPTGLRRKLPLAAPDRVSKTQVRLTDHELQISGEGIPAGVRRGPPTQYRLWIRRIPRTCAARGRRCLDKERPESGQHTHHWQAHLCLDINRVFGGTGEPRIRPLLVKCVGQRAHSTRLFDRQKPHE